jgi:predicted site-specific integrase-resolvase
VADSRSAPSNGGERQPALLPRLLSLAEAAVYLGMSYWTVRDYVLQGLVPTVTMPGLRPKQGDRPKQTLRRVLIDREDLDAFVCSRKRKPL